MSATEYNAAEVGGVGVAYKSIKEQSHYIHRRNHVTASEDIWQRSVLKLLSYSGYNKYEPTEIHLSYT